jgi:hypothetical protein
MKFLNRLKADQQFKRGVKGVSQRFGPPVPTPSRFDFRHSKGKTKSEAKKDV